eukprot:scaffold97266_cov48-Phaeocystis_antarctica.AAC.1
MWRGLSFGFDCGDVGRLRGPAAQERELEHLIEPYAQHLDASSRTRATRPCRTWWGRLCEPPAARGNHALAETMIMERMSAAHRKRGPEVSPSFNTFPVTPKGTTMSAACRLHPIKLPNPSQVLTSSRNRVAVASYSRVCSSLP